MAHETNIYNLIDRPMRHKRVFYIFRKISFIRLEHIQIFTPNYVFVCEDD